MPIAATRLAVAVALWFVAPLVVLAAEPEASQPVAQPRQPWWQWERITGDWGGVRTALEERGVEVSMGLTVVWQANHRGGLRSHPQG